MNAVPVRFIESVLRTSGPSPCQVGQISGVWGKARAAYEKKTFRLHLTYIGRQERSLHYILYDWELNDAKTLSLEVLREVAENIGEIEFHATEDRTRNNEWQSVSPELEKGLLRLVLRLDVPKKVLKLSYCPDLYEELKSRYYNLLRSFTSLELTSFDDRSIVGIVQDTVSSGRLRSISVDQMVPATVLTTDFWVDYFFSPRCEALSVTFEDHGFSVVLGIINRWKRRRPGALSPNKTIDKLIVDPNELLDAGMIQMSVDSIDAEILGRIQRRGETCERIDSFYRIEHPMDSSSNIYAVFFEQLRIWGRRWFKCILLF
uniref:FBA_2 domain-containing protein n=1 Tax=Steinernema glaseri TaxID=37863 RepID=A0A1I7YSH8_9BILA